LDRDLRPQVIARSWRGNGTVEWRARGKATSKFHQQITNGVMRRALRALAAQAVKGAAWERRGNPLRRASPGCAGFMNLITLAEM
jgi:hypothetical protein